MRTVPVEGQDGGGLVREQRGDSRVEGASRALPNHSGSELCAAEQVLERGVAGHVDNPQREWDLLPRS
jgi:hypothetical protein